MSADGRLLFEAIIDNSGFTAGLGNITTMAATTVATITAAFTAASAAAIDIGMNYESSMSQVAATMGITSSAAEFRTLSIAAKEMGEATQFSASQAGEALNYLALAGYNAEKSVAALPTVLNVAAAGGIELASASDMITDAMSALGLETAQMSVFADQLAVTSQKSNTTVAQLGEAILTVGGTAKSLSGGVTELNTALGILADNGIKGSEGGTMLRNVVLSLSAPTNKAAEAIAGLGVTAFDAQGNLRPLQDVFYDLNTALSSLSQQEQNAVLTEIFNKEDLKGVNALLGTSAERFDELSGYIDNCSGAAAQMAATMNDNLKGDLTIMQSALEGLGIAAYEKFQVPMRTAVQDVTASIGDLTENLTDGKLSDSMDKVATAFSGIASKALEALANDVIPTVIDGFALIVEHGDMIISTVTGIGAAFATWKIISIITPIVAGFQTANVQLALLAAESGAAAVSQTALAGGLSLTEIAVGLFTGKITAATAAEAAFNAVCSVNPIVLIATAIAAATVALVTYANTCDSTHNKIKEINEAMEAAAQSTEDSISASEGEIAVVEEKMQKYESLRKQYEETGKGEEQLRALAEELQQYMPEGTQLIDEQSGAYNSLVGSIDSVTEAMRRKATISAYEDEYTELIKQQLAAEKALDEASQKLSETSKWGLAGEVYNAKDYNDALKTVEDIEKRKAELEGEIGKLYEESSQPQANDDSGTDYKSSQQMAAEEYARNYTATMQQQADETAEKQKELNDKLSSGWKKLEHEYATGTIASEAELWSQKSALLDKYGNADLEDHWKYYEDLYGYQQDHADEAVQLAEKSAEEEVAARQSEWENIERLNSLGLRTDEETAKARADFVKKYYGNADLTTGEGVTDENYQYLKKVYDDNLDITKQSLDEQQQVVDDGLSAIIKRYREAYDELDQKRKSYRDKLLSVGGDLFSVEEIENPDGSKSKQYTVNNIDEQLNKMREYNSAVKKLKAEGASEGLLSELTSLGSEDSAQFAKYLSGMSASEFAKINEMYNEKQRLADELANDLYKDDAQRISGSMTDALGELAVSAYSYGAQAAEEFSKGFSEAANKLGINSLYSQLQAAGSTKSYENYLTVNQPAPDVNVTVTPGTTSIYLDGKKIGEANTVYESQQSKITGR